MYPLALKTIRDSLEQLDSEGVPYRIEGFMWHQGENDMFNPGVHGELRQESEELSATMEGRLKGAKPSILHRGIVY